VDFFTPQINSFDDLRDSTLLVDKYADPDGHIRRLPLWFHDDDLDLIAPHGLRLFKGNALKCRNTTQNGGLHAIYTDTDGRWAEKICVPEDCPDYQASPKRCRFGGQLYFYVPGQLSPNPLRLVTTSLNGYRLIWSALMQVMRIRGRISLTHKGKTFFELIKVRQMVQRKEGDKLVRVPQWLPALSLNVDPMELICDDGPRQSYFIPTVPLAPGVGQPAPKNTPTGQGLQAEQAEPTAPAPAAATQAPLPGSQEPSASPPADQTPPATAAAGRPPLPGPTAPAPADPKAGKAAAPATAGAQDPKIVQKPPATAAAGKTQKPGAVTAASLKSDIVRCLPLLGVSSAQMVLWANRIAGTPVNMMDVPALTDLLKMLRTTIDGHSSWALDEITLAWALDRLDVSFVNFNFWLEASARVTWTQAIFQNITATLMQNIRARVSSDLDAFKNEIEEAAALRRAA
jgi:hypothetical protein